MRSRSFEIRVRGTIPPEVLDDIGDNVHIDFLTVLTGRVRDQSALHSVLRRLQDLGVEVIALRTADRESNAESP